MQTLDFSLHPFQRVSWVSKAMQAQWQDKLQNMAEQLGGLLPQIFARVYPVQLQQIYPHELESLQQNYAEQKLSVQVLEMDESELAGFYLDFDYDDRKIAVLIGCREDIQRSLQAINEGDLAAYHQSLGTPACCSHFLHGLQQRGIKESTWPMAQLDSTSPSREVKVQGDFANNVLLRKRGLYLINHRPCSSACEASTTMGRQVFDGVKQASFLELANELQEILSWSYSWSTLHGIAELKTPIFKLIYNSQPCAVKYRVDWQGISEPDTGIQGLGFPYREPDKMVFSSTAAFKRGLDNSSIE